MEPQRDNSNRARTFRCADCGAVNPIGAAKCFLCGRKFVDGSEAATAPPVKKVERELSTAQPATRGTRTYSLSSLFLIVTLAAVCFGFIAQAPGLAIPIVVLITPALLSTFVKSRRRRAAGDDFTTADKIQAFATTVGVVILTIFAGAAAFLAACFVSCTAMLGSNSARSSENFFAVALVVSAVFGIFIMIVTAVQFWKQMK